MPAGGDAGIDRIRDHGFDLMTADGVFSWVRPDSLVQTQDSSFNSVLDFLFVAATRRAVRWRESPVDSIRRTKRFLGQGIAFVLEPNTDITL